MSYNNAIPQAGDLISTSQGEILANFTAIDSGTTGTGIGFSRNHVTMTDATNGGLHNRVDYYQAVSSPSISGFIGSAYPKTVTNVELFYKNGTADMQISNSSLSASGGEGMLPGGLLIKAGSGSFDGMSVDSLITFTNPFTNGFISANAIINSATSITLEILLASETDFTVRKLSSSGTQSFYWIAVGY